MIVLHAPVHQLDKVKSLAPVQIWDSIFEGVSKANSFGIDESSIAVNETQAGKTGVVDGIDGFRRDESINTNYQRDVRKSTETGMGETGGDIWRWC